jgi:[protein-PII] uridylyltransferase
MQDLLDKIETSAASRLVLPPGRQPVQEIPRYKAFLKVETHRLLILHRGGASGMQVCHARSAILDALLRNLWETVRAGFSAQAQKEFPPLALVAIGGYGRAELNPHSDIDVMFLHERQVVAGSKALPHLSRILEGIYYPLLDSGVKIGHSVRTIDECVKEANRDMQSKTSMIESRLIIGDKTMFERFQKTIENKCVKGFEDRYIALRLEDQESRRTKHGNSPFMQEPNLKNGCGGLRDYQNLLWMAWFKYRTRSLKDLQEREFISESDRRQLAAAYDFLLKTRTEMHYLAGRAADVLGKNLQPAVAHNLGYRDRSPSRRIEAFMRDLYKHQRNILLITRSAEQRMALIPKPPGLSARAFRALLPKRRTAAPEPVDGFRFVDGEIHAASNRIFRDQPRRLMRVFLHAQQRGLKLHPDLAQLLRSQVSLADSSFQTDPHVRETFLEILNQRGNVGPILRTMHELDLLGKYLPEFGRLTCLVQHEFYHQYAADEHTLVCLEQLDRIWDATKTPYSAYSPLFQNLERPYVLYLALLLHDVGKALDHGHHAAAGSAMAGRVARRLALDESVTHTLQRLIENHLLMAGTSQRRDLDDPAVIQRFARSVQNLETLTLLTLHTFADAQATSDKLWNGFKDSLLWALYHRTRALVAGGPEFVRAEVKKREQLMEEVRKLMPAELGEDELEAHFNGLPPRYFEAPAPEEILDDLTLVNRFIHVQLSEDQEALDAVLNWQNEPDRGCNVVKLCTWDRAGLFSKIAGSFSAVGLNILSARIFTRADDLVLDTFHVTDARSGGLGTTEQREKFESVLRKALTAEEPDFRALIAKQKTAVSTYQGYAGERLPTLIRFDNELSDTRTLIEIETEDRLGLLYVISQTFSELNLDISTARISTERGAAIDTFYIGESKGGQIVAAERQRAIERKLRHAIHSLDAT